MKFPLSRLDVKEYNDKIQSLLKDKDCRIYLDTNIIALLYGIHDSARKEFFDWLKTLIVDNRIKIPVWVINEYTNRFIRNQIQDYLKPLKKVSTIKKEFEQVSAFLKMHIEDSSLSQSKYTSVSEFQKDLDEIQEKIEKIAFTAKSKDENYKLKIHDDINQILGGCILNSDIDDILTSTDLLGLIRYNHKLPPGFQDEKKDLNAHGDLILWYEILKDCRSSKLTKAILVTDDEKKDWVYAPNRIVINSKEKSNQSNIKIADPRLIHEFHVYTKSEDFYIINFEQLTKILLENVGGNFTNLANALQLVHSQSNENENGNNEIVTINTQNDHAETIVGSKTEAVPLNQDTKTSVVSEPTTKYSSGISYSSYALADGDFPLADNSYFTKVIEQLKSYNWYVQNPCIEELQNFDSSSLAESKSNSDAIFVIGRNIYQAATGGSGSAWNFIQNFRKILTKYTDYFAVHLYSGMLYEIYFDSSNRFRGNELKSKLINEVLEVNELERLKPSLEFIKNALISHEKELLFLPYKNDNVKIEIEFDEKPLKAKNWMNEDVEYLKVKEIYGNGFNLLTEDKEKALNIYYPDFNYSGLIEFICTTYGIPSKKYEVSIKPDIDKSLPIVLGDKMLAPIESK